ncbi:MAG: adenine phosphoribosyltransferase [Candidatus Latescibacteria bacterium]|nr:adenine phosphoribosyltransferase [Gemmatimonadaceae bacterium]MDP7449630.1 adenine phosphoribosyltransferase [Candidatus Latescibacterota bacterium]MDP7631377.1 adenine phosphoribosyltransferase [Candidatus Latescibacterota bacterium]HJP31825.1 adenine phosphoribosyltransferase [Candidatus Latescibacterota bacterium]
MTDSDHLRALVRDVADFPKAGIVFRDITPLLKDPTGLQGTIDALTTPWVAEDVDFVAGIEARGFVLGPAVALRLGAGFLPVRKAGKLPCAVARQEYELEYGSATIELHRDALSQGDRVVIVDDVLATGGTAGAAVALVESLGATVVGLSFLVELTALEGRTRVDGRHIESVITY